MRSEVSALQTVFSVRKKLITALKIAEAEGATTKPGFFSFPHLCLGWISPLEAATKRRAINPCGTNGYHDIGMHGPCLPLPHQAILTGSNQS